MKHPADNDFYLSSISATALMTALTVVLSWQDRSPLLLPRDTKDNDITPRTVTRDQTRDSRHPQFSARTQRQAARQPMGWFLPK